MAGRLSEKEKDDIHNDSAATESDVDSSSDSDQDDEQTNGKTLDVLTAYHKLSSRRVDLVGDYAGNELFLIEGDSLLLHCFSDPHLDFEDGFQALHACYLVENFLSQLQQRKCNFHVVFFRNHRHLCIPDNVTEQNAPKYLLAREAIISHLTAHVEDSTNRIRIFDSISCEPFQQYLAQTGLYFMMCHDGANQSHQPGKGAHKTSNDGKHTEAFRKSILYFLARGYNVALVNGLEWRDTKVMTMVLERSRSRHYPDLGALLSSTTDSLDKTQDNNLVVSLKDSFSSSTEKMDFSQRELLAILTISQLLMRQDQLNVSQDVLEQLAVLFLLHVVVLRHLPISARCFEESHMDPSQVEFLSLYSATAESILGSNVWHDLSAGRSATCDLADLADGRLFSAVVLAGVDKVPQDILTELTGLCDTVSRLSGHKLESTLHQTSQANGAHPATSEVEDATEQSDIKVLPFSNPVFDQHLKSIHLSIDQAGDGKESASAGRIFRELSHWHNVKRPIEKKGPAPAVSAKDEFWALRRNQWFMAEMANYAASLTNAIGKSLEPETIVVGAPRSATTSQSSSRDASPAPKQEDSKAAKGKAEPKKKGGKLAAQNAAKQAMLDNIAAGRAKKEEVGTQKWVQAWHVVCKDIFAEKDLSTRHALLKDYFISLPNDKTKVLEAEVQLSMLSTLLEYWTQLSQSSTKDPGVAARIWHACRTVAASSGLTKTISEKVELTLKTLSLPSIPISRPTDDRTLPFTYASLTTSKASLAIDLASKDFQLLHCGPYLDRSIDSAPDHRVEFNPDAWQKRVLDGIDADKSLFVVAPTSAGKTFISFYAMRKILEADDDGVLVYVAPTKALVNQVAAEISARYSKKFKYGGKSVWAIHTRDYRINNPSGCQVLVTVPHVLQIMLLAPSNANSWSKKVKRIIFDEIHSIGNAEDGVVWEQLLLLAPCPIIALSATVGNPHEFSEWLSNTQAAIGNEVLLEGTTQRYSDLRKFNYAPPKTFAFNGLGAKASFSKLGLDGTPGLGFIHPIASLVNKSRGIPDDLSLEPRDCIALWTAMVKHQNKSYPVPDDLNPQKLKVLPEIVGKKDIIPWERALKGLVKAWMTDDKSPFDAVVAELGQTFHKLERPELQKSPASTSTQMPNKPRTVRSDDLLSTTLPLLCSLQEQDALPAIFFNYERGLCEKICIGVVKQLQDAEETWKASSPKWKAKLQAWEEWKKVQTKLAAKKPKEVKSSKKGSKEDREEADGEGGSRLDNQREAGSAESSEFERFDPEAPVEGFHFADQRKLLKSELEVAIRQLVKRGLPQWQIDSLHRGIGVHHAGMNRKYRQVIEILFRKGFLRVVIATGTLALGINMPCKTVVFSGDSVFLTALNFRQGAGRAGRRGFDLLGNVVFQGISEAKICRLISSRLPDLQGHFPVTTTLVLRLFTLLHESKGAPYAVKAINSLLSQPRLYMGGPAFKDQTLHHLRFSIEYLRRQSLLDAKGATLNFAGLVSHLYYTENASFAFHALLKEGYFHRLCANIDTSERSTIDTLMLVMSHLFGRVYCRQADEEYKDTVVKPSSSIVFLPNLPEDASRVLREHAEDTLQVFKCYVSTFVDQHLQDQPDNELPLTKVKIGASEFTQTKGAKDDTKEGKNNVDDWEAEADADDDVNDGHKIPELSKLTRSPTKIRSHFVSLSGHNDKFTSISDLCRTTRSGVFLEESVIPHVGSYPDTLDSPLNAYLLDFFKHGDINTLERANRVRKGDVWFLLNDFSMVMATVITALMNFMKLKPSGDLDMLDVMGSLDIHEEAEDDKLAATETEVVAPVQAEMVEQRAKPVVNKKKNKNLDSWEDEVEEHVEDKEAKTGVRDGKDDGTSEWTDGSAWEGQGGEQGLLKVLKAFQILNKEFNEKFRKMWA